MENNLLENKLLENKLLMKRSDAAEIDVIEGVLLKELSVDDKVCRDLLSKGIVIISGELTPWSTPHLLRLILGASLYANELRVLIHSEGGVLTIGWALYDLLEAIAAHKRVITIGLGRVQSAATLPFLAGTERLATRGCIFTLHEAHTVTVGKVSEHEDTLKMLRKYETLYDELVASKTKLSKRTIRERRSRREWHFTAEEALKYGFAHRFAEPADLLPF